MTFFVIAATIRTQQEMELCPAHLQNENKYFAIVILQIPSSMIIFTKRQSRLFQHLTLIMNI